MNDVGEEIRSRLHGGTDHEYHVVRRTIANGAVQLWEQCSICGNAPRAVKSSDPRVVRAVEIGRFDDALRDEFQRKISQEYSRRWTEEAADRERQRLIEKDQEQALWWAEYNDYLQSGDWQARRLMVLERDGHLCQGCRRERATQVHHLTYVHLGAEPLWDLIAVCTDCHERVTMIDRARRGAA